MALTGEEKLRVHALLGVNYYPGVTAESSRYVYSKNIELNDILENLTDDQETMVREILTQYTTNTQYNTDTLDVKGFNSDPERLEKKLKGQLQNILNFTPGSKHYKVTRAR